MRYPNEITTPNTKLMLKYSDILTAFGAKGIGIDLSQGAVGKIIAQMTACTEDLVYRINVDYADGHVSVISFGIENVDSDADATYDSIQELPQWMQERIAVLSMMSHEPPTANVVGVGRRISKSVYWVYKPSTR
jgi:hypothetical protein